MSYWDGNYYTPTKPKEVKDGIKLQSKNAGSTWWSKKWISVLESFGWSNRLQRGRNYARKGQVINFKINPGVVTAKVQGSASRPYSVEIKIRTFNEKEWEKILKELSSQAIFIAKLLNNEMPQDIEKAFSSAGLSLLPESSRDIKTYCSCPDSANPCKHIAAVHYILAEEFDRDPFMIFSLRGMGEKEITSALGKIRASDSETRDEQELPELPELQCSDSEKNDAVSIEKCIDCFWSKNREFEKAGISISAPVVQSAILKRLGAPSFLQDKDALAEMEKIYKFISDYAVSKAYDSDYDSGD